MPSKGAFTIIAEDTKVLLVKRKDLPFWDLPGGIVEKSESCEAGAVRETLEETGLIVRIDYLIATYHLLFKNDQQSLFAASIAGGQLKIDGPETKAIRYFDKDQLPINLIPLRKRQVTDYFYGKKELSVSVKKPPVLFRIDDYLKKAKKFLST